MFILEDVQPYNNKFTFEIQDNKVRIYINYTYSYNIFNYNLDFTFSVQKPFNNDRFI